MLKDFRLNKRQIEKLSDIISDIALVILASVTLPALLDKVDLARLLLGVILIIICWYTSLKLRK